MELKPESSNQPIQITHPDDISRLIPLLLGRKIKIKKKISQSTELTRPQLSTKDAQLSNDINLQNSNLQLSKTISVHTQSNENNIFNGLIDPRTNALGEIELLNKDANFTKSQSKFDRSKQIQNPVFETHYTANQSIFSPDLKTKKKKPKNLNVKSVVHFSDRFFWENIDFNKTEIFKGDYFGKTLKKELDKTKKVKDQFYSECSGDDQNQGNKEEIIFQKSQKLKSLIKNQQILVCQKKEAVENAKNECILKLKIMKQKIFDIFQNFEQKIEKNVAQSLQENETNLAFLVAESLKTEAPKFWNKTLSKNAKLEKLKIENLEFVSPEAGIFNLPKIKHFKINSTNIPAFLAKKELELFADLLTEDSKNGILNFADSNPKQNFLGFCEHLELQIHQFVDDFSFLFLKENHLPNFMNFKSKIDIAKITSLEKLKLPKINRGKKTLILPVLQSQNENQLLNNSPSSVNPNPSSSSPISNNKLIPTNPKLSISKSFEDPLVFSLSKQFFLNELSEAQFVGFVSFLPNYAILFKNDVFIYQQKTNNFIDIQIKNYSIVQLAIIPDHQNKVPPKSAIVVLESGPQLLLSIGNFRTGQFTMAFEPVPIPFFKKLVPINSQVYFILQHDDSILAKFIPNPEFTAELIELQMDGDQVANIAPLHAGNLLVAHYESGLFAFFEVDSQNQSIKLKKLKGMKMGPDYSNFSVFFENQIVVNNSQGNLFVINTSLKEDQLDTIFSFCNFESLNVNKFWVFERKNKKVFLILEKGKTALLIFDFESKKKIGEFNFHGIFRQIVDVLPSENSDFVWEIFCISESGVFKIKIDGL